jgi:hypothetical protein
MALTTDGILRAMAMTFAQQVVDDPTSVLGSPPRPYQDNDSIREQAEKALTLADWFSQLAAHAAAHGAIEAPPLLREAADMCRTRVRLDLVRKDEDEGY